MDGLELTMRVLIGLVVCGFTVVSANLSSCAEVGGEHELFLRHVDSTVQEAMWKPSEPRVVYVGQPATHEERYRVIPCIVRMRDGTLVALVEPGKNPVFIRSTDGGTSWSEPYTGVSPDKVGGVNALGVRRDGRLMGVFSKAHENLGTSAVKKQMVNLADGRQCLAFEGYRYGGDLQLGYSSDQGKTWTVETNIDISPMVAAWTWTGGRILELHDGTLLVPVAGYLSDQDMDGIWLSAGVLQSHDDGVTWRFSIVGRGNPDDWIIFSEPAVAELDDGTLVTLMRTEDRVKKSSPGDRRGGRGGLHRSSSVDGGQMWSRPVKTLDGSHCSLTRLPGGILLCGYHRPPRLALSSNEGKAWYANMLWNTENPRANWGWYISVEMVDQTTAVVLVKETPAPNIIRACLLHRQP